MIKTVLCLLVLALMSISGVAIADQYVQGYVRQNGTYVQPYHRSTPNNTPIDNYSTKGNVNPYTGQQGDVNPYKSLVPSTDTRPNNYYYKKYTSDDDSDSDE